MSMSMRLRRQDPYVHYDAWRNIGSSALRSDDFIPILQDDFKTAEITLDQVKDFIWVFDHKPEGISADDTRGLYEYFKNLGVPDKNFRVAFSCVENVDVLPYPAISLPDRLIYNGNWLMHLKHFNIFWENLPMTHKLVCLMRRPSIGRGNLAKRLLGKFRLEDLIMTFGTNGEYCDDNVKKLIWPHSFPMIVDRPMADQVFQHRIDHDFFYRAPVNLVVESSSQLDPNTWRSIFITEKTFKALAWHQFPLWYAVPGLVNEVRKLGFDVFDDIFENHEYDTETEPWFRMTKVVMLAKRVCSQDTVAMRKKHWLRLRANAELVEKIHNEALSRHQQALNKLIYGT